MNGNGLFVQFLLISPLLLVSLVLHELAHGVAVNGVENLHGVLGQPGFLSALGQRCGNGEIGTQRFLAAA